ncbi:MAG TPA: hypothetical protein VMT71_16430 [Syntrophorhabdales bacterium]|nr:hypothetical protein [Syntrophorhabdales bacterium]
MKKLSVGVAVVIGLAMVGSVYSQIWLDTTVPRDAFVRDERFKFTGEIQNVDSKSQTAVVRIGDKAYLGNFEFATFEGGYSALSHLKIGDKVSGEGVIAEGQNWVTRIKKAAPDAAPGQVLISD